MVVYETDLAISMAYQTSELVKEPLPYCAPLTISQQSLNRIIWKKFVFRQNCLKELCFI